MDSQLKELIGWETKRQEETLQMIPSENYASPAVREILGSVLTNKYSEGYSGRRYYQGNSNIDQIENLAIERAKRLFGVPYVNVQPYSGSPANAAVYFALCEAGDTVMGMQLAAGGHLTHGQPKITFSGKYFNPVQFGLNDEGYIDYEEVSQLAREHKPKLMMIGTTAYPRVLDWERFSQIVEEVEAWLVADISHVSGLVVAGVYPSPVEYAHVVTTTTHKTLRGPRGAMIMVTQKGLDRDPELGTKIDRAVFPGLQGGPHDNVTAAIAQALYEAGKPEFKEYGKKVLENAQALSDELKTLGLDVVSGGTDCHLLLINLKTKELSGNVVAEALEIAGIVTNRNSVPGDTSPFYPSGIRLGTPSLTTRGMGILEMKQIASLINRVVEVVKDERLPDGKSSEKDQFIREFVERYKDNETLLDIGEEVRDLCKRFSLE